MGKLSGLNLNVDYEGTQLANAKTCTLNISKRRLPTYTKTTAQTAEFVTHFSGAKRWSVSASVNIDLNDSPGIDELTTAFLSDVDVTVRFKIGSAYLQGEAKVHNLVMTGSVNDIAVFSCTFEGNGVLSYTDAEGFPYVFPLLLS